MTVSIFSKLNFCCDFKLSSTPSVDATIKICLYNKTCFNYRKFEFESNSLFNIIPIEVILNTILKYT